MRLFDSSQWALMGMIRDSRSSPSMIEKRQKRRLKRLLQFARKRSPFYKKLYSGLKQVVPDLSSLPVITKRQIRNQVEEVCTDPRISRASLDQFISNIQNLGKLYLGKYLVSITSGTTGKRDPFLSDEFTAQMGVFFTQIRGGLSHWYGFGGILRFFLRGGRYALLDMTGSPFAGVTALEWQLQKFPRNRKRIKLISVLSGIDEQVEELNRFKPSAIGGYPSALLLLAREKNEGRLKINPEFLIYTGEVITPSRREFIERSFVCKGYEEYGSTENNVMAVECEKGWLHYHSDWLILEPVTKEYRPVPKGEVSHSLLVTNLLNRAMPLIRYDQGDQVLMKEGRCECGSPFPAMKVMGRKEDMLSLPSKKGGKISKNALDLIEISESVEGVILSQIVQRSPVLLEFRLMISPQVETRVVWSKICDRVQRYLRKNGITEVKLRLSVSEPTLNLRSGKMSLLIKDSGKILKTVPATSLQESYIQ